MPKVLSQARPWVYMYIRVEIFLLKLMFLMRSVSFDSSEFGIVSASRLTTVLHVLRRL